MEIIKFTPTPKFSTGARRALSKAILAIEKGKVIICPTDTVYGFLALATNKKAVDKIFKIKKRIKSKSLPVFVKDIKMAKELAEVNEEQEKILIKYWFTHTLKFEKRLWYLGKGKYTFILKRKSDVKLYGVSKDTIAIRIPKYKLLNDLLKKINKPLVQTSVNMSGEPPLINIGNIKAKFGVSNHGIIIIDAGNLKKAKPSKIIDLTSKNKKILRK